MADTTNLQEWAIDQGYDREERRRLVAVADRIRKYRVPAYVVSGSDERVLRTIYGRANRAGLRLEEHEVFEALHGSLVGDEPSSLDAVIKGIDALAYGSIKRDTVYQTLLAIEGRPLDRPLDLSRPQDHVQAARALRQTAAALRRVLEFLRSDADVPHLALLPYELPLIVLGRFFHEFEHPSPRSRILLRRWLWRGSLSYSLTGARVGKRQHIEAFCPGDETASVSALLALASAPKAEDIGTLGAFNFGFARSKMQLCALASLRPRDVRTGEIIDLPSAFTAYDDRAVSLLGIDAAGQPRNAGLTVRFLHGGITPARLRDALCRCEDPLVLASHAVTRSALSALRERDDATFLAERGRSLRELADDDFARRAEWGADDSTSLDAMVIEE